MNRRIGPFVAIGALGFVLQLSTLVWLTSGWHWPYLIATVVAVEAAVLHNFAWHERWTWGDRRRAATFTAMLQRLAKFQLGTGLASIGGNVIVTSAVVELLHAPPVVANAIAVGVTSAANFIVADRWVFKAAAPAAFAVLCLVSPQRADASELRAETIAAWNRHIAAVEAHLDARPIFDKQQEPTGRSIAVPGGVVHEWRGSVRLRGLTVSELVHALEVPGLPPPADDVLEARVLGRDGNDRLHVYLKLTRSAIITVVYDTEHDVSFERLSPELATSRSVSTRIQEVGGSDRGFLWRLNSYWSYRQVGDDVQVDVLSVSLSRSVPAIARPIAGPIVERIARESMQRTLDAMARFGAGLRDRRPEANATRTR
jgi:putative flippase GtrA